jgi:HK97 family phage prohead protease
MNHKTDQKRIIEGGGIELRKAGDGELFVGMPVVYNSPSQVLFNYFQERMLPGCFDEHLANNPDILCLRDHNVDKILGRTSAGTLKIARGDDGIRIECKRSNTTYALDLAENIRNGDIRGMSFHFDVLDDDWYMKDGVRTRDVIRATVQEFSFVTMPAYPDSEAGLRDADSMKAEIDALIGRKDALERLGKIKRRLRYLQY